MQDKFKAISYEEVRPRLGSSCMTKDLIYFTEDENNFRMEVREWGINEILPYVDEIDKNNDQKLAIELAKKTAKQGYSNQMVPREYGGGGRNCVAEVIVFEELGAADFAVPGAMQASCTFLGFTVYRNGSEELKQKITVPVLKGEIIGGMAMTEPAAGSNFGGTETEATRDGDGWLLNGEKRFIGNGSTADYLLTFAVTNPEAKRPSERLTAFVIDTKQPGFELVKDFNLLGLRGLSYNWFRMNNLRVPDNYVVGEVNKGYEVAMGELDAERIGTTGLIIGTMRSAYELAVRYSMERTQFGQKISNFQAISFRLVDMLTQIETSRLLAWRVAKQVDMGLPATTEASILKCYTTEAAIKVVESAFQIIGGIAYTADYPIERYLRDSRVFTIFAGTNEIQRFIAARTILREARDWPLG